MAPRNVHDEDKSPLAMEKRKGAITQSIEQTGNAALLSLPFPEGVPSYESEADDGDDRDTKEVGTTLPEMDEAVTVVNTATDDNESMAETLFILDYVGATEEMLEKEDAQCTVLASNTEEGQATNAKPPPQQEASLDQVKERIQVLVATNAPLSLSSLARVYQNQQLGFEKIGRLVETMDSIEIELDKISRKKHFLSIIDKSKKLCDCLGCGIPVTGWNEAMEHVKLCCPELMVDCDSSELHRQCVVGNEHRILRVPGHDKSISLFRYWCPNCGDIQHSLKRCSEHLQGCCPSLLDNRDFLRPRCMLKRDVCDVPGFKTSKLAKDASLSPYDIEVIRLKRLVATHQPVSLTKVPELYNAMFQGKRLHARGFGFSSLEDFVGVIPSVKVSKAHPLAERIQAIQREPTSHLPSSGKRQQREIESSVKSKKAKYTTE